MTRAALFMSTADLGAVQDLGWKSLLIIPIGALVAWAFKKDWVGIVTFGPYDRGFREFFGRPGRLLKQGPHPHIVGLGNLRRASTAISVLTMSNRVNLEGRVYSYTLEVMIHIKDEAEHIHAAIYKTFDEGKKDSYNAQRLIYVRTTIEETARMLFESEGAGAAITAAALTERCGDHLLLMCGTVIERAMITELTPVDAQIIKDGMTENRLLGDERPVVIPFRQQSELA